jgi:hypothetical protein
MDLIIRAVVFITKHDKQLLVGFNTGSCFRFKYHSGKNPQALECQEKTKLTDIERDDRFSI